MNNFKKIILIASLFVFNQPASADTWLQNGVWVSDTCTDRYGNWFVFNNNYGVVRTRCTWFINGIRYRGRFGG